MPAKGQKHDPSLKKQVVITLLFGSGKQSNPLHLRFNSILEAEQKLGINRGFIHRLANKKSSVIGVLSVIGEIAMEDCLNEKATKNEIHEKVLKEHLQNVSWECQKHKVHIANGTKCPLCKRDKKPSLSTLFTENN